MGIISDLKAGTQGELIVSALLDGVKLKWEKSTKETKYDYDILSSLDEQPFSIEVKYDRKFAITGNIAIEWWNSKKNEASGILVSKANIWAYVLKDEVWFIRRDKLVEMFNNKSPKPKLINNVGDGNANIALYCWDEISVYFTRVDNLDKDCLLSIIRKMINVAL